MRLRENFLIILLIFLMLFVCIGSVSALENQTDDIGENKVIGIDESQEILSVNEYTYGNPTKVDF